MSIALENGVEIHGEPVEVEEKVSKKTKSPRQRATKKKATSFEPNPADSLLSALKFISVAQKKVGPPEAQFCKISHNWACASDGILTVAHPIEEDLTACPQTLLFIEALGKVKSDLSIAQINERNIVVNSGNFRGLIPCVSENEISITAPDPQIVPLNNDIKTALSSVLILATEGAPVATYATVLLQANSAVSTNGAAMLEYWHGIDLPPGMLLPKAAAVAIAKSPYDLTGFGYSGPSATFYFSNGSFIKTQLYGEKYPNYNHLLECDMTDLVDIPADFFVGIKALSYFSKEGNVFFKDGKLMSNEYSNEASSYTFEGLPDDMGFNIKYLQQVEHAFKKAKFDKEGMKVHFFDDNVRGALMGLRMSNISETRATDVTDDSDLPF